MAWFSQLLDIFLFEEYKVMRGLDHFNVLIQSWLFLAGSMQTPSNDDYDDDVDADADADDAAADDDD